MYYLEYRCYGCAMAHGEPDLTFGSRKEAKEEGAYSAQFHECHQPDVHVTVKVRVF